MTRTAADGGRTPASALALGALAVWRLTHLLAVEDGPGDVVARARARLGTTGAGELMDCFNCLSVWVSAAVAPFVARRRRDLPLTWLALSGAACLLERGPGTEPTLDLSATTGGETDALLQRNPRHGESRQYPGSHRPEPHPA